jgi:hypothetical protein
MKKIFTLAILPVVLTVMLTGCFKDTTIINDDSYWLSQERGDVVYSDSFCSYFVVETNYGYTIIRSRDGYRPFEGSIMYGDFGRYGSRDFYNRTAGYVLFGEVVEFDLSYTDAQLALDYYCPMAGKKIKESLSPQSKAKRQTTPSDKQ